VLNILTRTELADILRVSRQTLSNWEKDEDKKELIRLINQGLAFDEMMDIAKKNLSELEDIQKNANSGKFKLK